MIKYFYSIPGLKVSQNPMAACHVKPSAKLSPGGLAPSSRANFKGNMLSVSSYQQDIKWSVIF